MKQTMEMLPVNWGPMGFEIGPSHILLYAIIALYGLSRIRAIQMAIQRTIRQRVIVRKARAYRRVGQKRIAA